MQKFNSNEFLYFQMNLKIFLHWAQSNLEYVVKFSHELLLARGSAADVHACRFGCCDGWFALAALDTCDLGYIEARAGSDMEFEGAC